MRFAGGLMVTPIRLRNRRDPDPAWTPFDAPPPVPTRDTPAVADE